MHLSVMNWFTYILLCDQKYYYVGLTHDIQQRVRSHQNKENIGTKEFTEYREKQLKGWSVAKKNALIEGNFELLKKLSKNK